MNMNMKVTAIMHEAEEGGYWAEVPAIPGCATEGETIDELIANLREAVEGCLDGAVESELLLEGDRLIEVTL